jgi:hypothetical protein
LLGLFASAPPLRRLWSLTPINARQKCARINVATRDGPAQTLDSHGGGRPPGFCFIYDDLARSWYGVPTPWMVWRPWEIEACAVQSVPVVPPNSIRKLPFVPDWLFFGPRPANHHSTYKLNSPCHAERGMWKVTRHIPSATCPWNADAPSWWGLLYKQSLCPASMPFPGQQQPSVNVYDRLGSTLAPWSFSSWAPWHLATCSQILLTTGPP